MIKCRYRDRIRKVCLSLRREQYYDKIPAIQFQGLPYEINQKIHYYRDADDLTTPSKKQMEEVLGVHDGDWQRTKLIRRMFWLPWTDFREAMEPWWNDYIIAGIMLSGSIIWKTIQYHTLSPRLRKIPQLLFMTNHWDEQALLYADESLRNSHDICMHYLLARHTGHYECLPSKFKEDRNFNVELILKRPEYFQRLSYTFRDDKEIALLLVPYWGSFLEYVSDRLQDDDELVSIAADTQYGWKCLRYASERLQNDPRFQLKIAEGRAQEAKEEAQIKAEIEQM